LKDFQEQVSEGLAHGFPVQYAKDSPIDERSRTYRDAIVASAASRVSR